MRVLLLNTSNGGIGRYGALFSAAVDKVASEKGHDVFVIQDAESNDFYQRGSSKKNNYINLKFVGANKILSFIRIIKIFLKFKPHIIQDVSGSTNFSSCLLLPVFRIFGAVFVVEHDPLPHSGMGGWKNALARKIIAIYANGVFVHGAYSKELAISSGIMKAKLTVIPHGELSIFGHLSKDVERERNTVLFFGALRPNKGVDMLIDIASQVKECIPDVRFVVAGTKKLSSKLNSSPWKQELDSIMEKMKSDVSFEVHDYFIPDEMVGELFKRCSVTILPYKDATQSGVAMIALPLASILVATNVGDIGEVVINRRTGLITNVSVDELSRSVIEVLSNDDLRTEIMKNSIDFAFNNCSWDAVAQKVFSSYDLLFRNKNDIE